MPLESRSRSQICSLAPAWPAYSPTSPSLSTVIAITSAGTSQSGGLYLPYVVVQPFVTGTLFGYVPQPGDAFQLQTGGGSLKEPTVFRVSTVTPGAGANYTISFTPLPAVTPVATDEINILPRPKNPRWLGAIGHVGGLKYSFTCPGGPDAASWTLQIPPETRTDALDPGRVIQIFRGAGCVWEGILDEPQPTSAGWTCTAHGAGTLGTNFASMYTTWGNPDDHVNEAITRGLRWVNHGIGTPAGVYLLQEQDSGSQTITDYLTLICTGGSLLWDVQEGQGSTLPSGPWQLRVFPYPTDAAGNPNGKPTRMLVATTPVARTIALDINTLVLRYQETPDIPAVTGPSGAVLVAEVLATFTTTTVQNTASAQKHGVLEYYQDITSAGTLTATQAQAIGNNILSRYIRANWAGPFTVGPGQYLNPGGVPVDLGCEHAGEVAQLICTDASLGGEVTPGPITFLVGSYEFDNDTDTATITPFAGVRMDMASLVSSMYPEKF